MLWIHVFFGFQLDGPVTEGKGGGGGGGGLKTGILRYMKLHWQDMLINM